MLADPNDPYPGATAVADGSADPRPVGRPRLWRSLRDREFWRPLFPQAPVGRVTLPGAALTALAVAAGTVLSLWRNAGTGPLDTTVMEDAKVFLADQIDHGFWASLVTPYSGYFHLVPRVLAWPAAVVAPEDAAAVMSVGAALVTALLAVFIYFASAGHFSATVQRVLVSAPVLVMPVAQIEIFNEINMLRWPLMYATFWAVLWVSPSRAGRIVGASVLVVAALSDNIVGIFVPLLLLRLWVNRRGTAGESSRWDRSAVVGASALVLTTLASAVVMLTNVSTRGLEPRIDPIWAVSAFIVRPVPQMMVGSRWATYDPAHTVAGALPVVAGWLVVLVVVLLALQRRTRPDWVLAAVATLYGFLIYVYTIVAVGFAGPRYSAPAGLLVLTAVVALLTPRTDRPRGVALAPLVAFTVLFGIVCATNIRMDSWRSEGPLWSDELSAARIVCTQTKAERVELRVSPIKVGWTASLPCSYILR